MANFSSALAVAESNLDNAVMTAATDLFVAVSGAAESRANTYATTLSTYVGEVTTASGTLNQVVLDKAKAFSTAERSAYETLVDAVHTQRVAAVDAWHATEATNWSAFVDAVADAKAALAAERTDAHTALYAAADPADKTLALGLSGAQATAATDSATAIRTFTTSSTGAYTTFEQSGRLALLDLTTAHNTDRASFMGTLSTQAADAEADSVAALGIYNSGLATGQGVLGTAVATESHTLATSLAGSGRTLAEASAGSSQTFRVTTSAAGRDRDISVADADKAQADAEANAAETHAGAIWPAWETERLGALTAGVTYAKALFTGAKSFSDTLASAGHTRASGLKTARGPVTLAYAEAENLIDEGVHGAVSARLLNWKAQVSAAGNPKLGDLGRYVVFYPVHEAALASLEPKWWEGLIPLYGSVYSAANNYSKGNIFWGTLDAVFAVGDGFMVKSLIQGLARAGASATAKLGTKARTMLTPRGPLAASGGSRGAVLSPFSRQGGMAKGLQGAHPYTHGFSARSVNQVGGTTNCAGCAIAMDATLAGRPANALKTGITPVSALEKHFERAFTHGLSSTSIASTMSEAGLGARGIVFGFRGWTKPGHFFNVVNQKGVVRFIDAQTGTVAKLDGFKSFWLLRTN